MAISKISFATEPTGTGTASITEASSTSIGGTIMAGLAVPFGVFAESTDYVRADIAAWSALFFGALMLLLGAEFLGDHWVSRKLGWR